MKRRFLALLLAMTMCVTPCYVYAEETEAVSESDGADVSAQELLQKANEYSSSISSMAMDMSFVLDAAVKASQTGEDGETQDFETGLKMDGKIDASVIMDPMQMAMNIVMSVDAAGQKEDIDMVEYMVASEDGSKFDVYAKVPDTDGAGEWQHMQQDMSALLEQLGVSSFKELAADGVGNEQLQAINDSIPYTVEETDTEYILSATVNVSDMFEAVAPIVEASMGDSDVDFEQIEPVLDMVLDCFVMNMTETLDKETCAPKSIHIDFNDSDLTPLASITAMLLGLSDLVTEEGNTFEVVLNEFSIDGTYSDINSVESIEIPEEALNTEVTEIADLSTAVEDVEEITE